MPDENYAALERVLESDIDFLEKIRAISDTIKGLVGADRCTIFIHDAATNSFWSAYIEGVSFIELPDQRGIVHEVFHGNKIQFVNDVHAAGLFNAAAERETGYIVNAILAAPITDDLGKPVGVIQLINKIDQESGFDNMDKRVVRHLMRRIQPYILRLSR